MNPLLVAASLLIEEPCLSVEFALAVAADEVKPERLTLISPEEMLRLMKVGHALEQT